MNSIQIKGPLILKYQNKYCEIYRHFVKFFIFSYFNFFLFLVEKCF